MPVLLVDDESTDGTADVARRAAEKTGKADALIVIQSKPLPAGWTGKLWAMHQGIERARELNPAWLMFADADVLHDAETVENLSCIASRGHYDLVSFMVKLHCESFPEKLLIPALFLFHALPASLGSRYPALDCRRGRGLHACEIRGSGTRRRTRSHSRRAYR
jgi:glycosyltransferase involved in cell wall biosynthesis